MLLEFFNEILERNLASGPASASWTLTERRGKSCRVPVVVKDFGEPSKGLTFLENYLKEQS